MTAKKQENIARKIKLCKEKGCQNQSTTKGYCRLCYLKNWKRIQTDKKKKASKNLNKYIDNIMRHQKSEGVQKLRDHLQDEESFERSLDDILHHDSLHDVMSDLGQRTDLDIMIDSIRIDEDF